MAVKLPPQLDVDWPFANVLPQAVIVPGAVAIRKLAGVDWNVILLNDV